MSSVRMGWLKPAAVWGGRLLMLVAIAWLAWRLWDQRGALASLNFGVFQWMGLYAVTLAYALVSILLALAWALAVRAMSPLPVRLRPLLAIHMKTQIAKYLPGNVLHYAGRQFEARALGVPQMPVAAASGLEIAGQAGTAALLVLVALWTARYVDNLPNPMIFLGMIMAIAATLWWLRGLLQDRLSLPSMALLTGLTGLYLTYLLLISGLFWLTGRLCGMENAAEVVVAGAFVIAWTIGFLVPGAPGGMGVREVILVTMLAPHVGEPAALSAAVSFRLTNMLGDTHLLVAGIFIMNRDRGEQ